MQEEMRQSCKPGLPSCPSVDDLVFYFHFVFHSYQVHMFVKEQVNHRSNNLAFIPLKWVGGFYSQILSSPCLHPSNILPTLWWCHLALLKPITSAHRAKYTLKRMWS